MALTITITPTEQMFRTDEGIPVRLWSGHTAAGVPVHAFVAAIASPDDAGSSELQRELHEIPGPQISQVQIDP